MLSDVHVRPGGLLRCGLATLEELHAERCLPTAKGSRINCRQCREPMRLRGGAWEWDASTAGTDEDGLRK